jgi:hypothetical protein
VNRSHLGQTSLSPGSYVGEVPPIFALAAGANFVYIAYELPTPGAEGILVNKDSPIQKIADLKGKRVAFNKGSDIHWLLINAWPALVSNTVISTRPISRRLTPARRSNAGPSMPGLSGTRSSSRRKNRSALVF